MRTRWSVLLLCMLFLAFIAASTVACTRGDAVEEEPAPLGSAPHIATQEDPIDPIPTELHLDARKVALGEQLFRDPILSPKGDVACTTCHDFEKGGTDRKPKSDLPDHAAAVVNTPTIFNVSLNYRFHWSGGYEDLSAQLTIPVTSPRVMATTFDAIVGRLAKSAEYPKRFGEIYADGITEATFRDAMVTYERSLITPNSRFDKYLRGDKTALTEDERAGYAIFKNHGCVSCHQGVNVGGNLTQKFGVMRDYFKDRPTITEADNGLYNITKQEKDRYIFRVPSLRNVALTAPYFHDASANTLEDAVQVMSRYQLGRKLSADQTRLLVAFLKTLTGEYQGKALE